MQGWMKTLDGRDVYDQGDGWVYYGRQQSWYYEPGLLTMPAAPLGARFGHEVDRLSTGWPTLKQAWRWQGPYSGGAWDRVLRVWVLFAGAYNALFLPLWILGWTDKYEASGALLTWQGRGIMFGVAAVLAFVWLYVDHVARRDPHKGALIGGASTALLVWRAHERHQHRGHGGHH